jgi:hypothetical protein
MERELCIFKITEEADPITLARSRLLRERFPQEYAVTRARRAVNLRTVPTDRDDLWSFIMLPDAPPVSNLPLSSQFPAMYRRDLDGCHLQRVTVDASRSDLPTPRARAAARAVQRREQEWAARMKEKRIRCREQQDEEYRLREQQGLSPPATPENSSEEEEEEEESDGGRAPPERSPPPPSPRTVGGSSGACARDGRRGARRQAVSGRGGACRGGAGEH